MCSVLSDAHTSARSLPLARCMHIILGKPLGLRYDAVAQWSCRGPATGTRLGAHTTLENGISLATVVYLLGHLGRLKPRSGCPPRSSWKEREEEKACGRRLLLTRKEGTTRGRGRRRRGGCQADVGYVSSGPRGRLLEGGEHRLDLVRIQIRASVFIE